MNDDDKQAERVERQVKVKWWHAQTEGERVRIISEAFDKEHPTTADKIAARKRFVPKEKELDKPFPF